MISFDRRIQKKWNELSDSKAVKKGKELNQIQSPLNCLKIGVTNSTRTPLGMLRSVTQITLPMSKDKTVCVIEIRQRLVHHKSIYDGRVQKQWNNFVESKAVKDAEQLDDIQSPLNSGYPPLREKEKTHHYIMIATYNSRLSVVKIHRRFVQSNCETIGWLRNTYFTFL